MCVNGSLSLARTRLYIGLRLRNILPPAVAIVIADAAI